MSQEHRQALPAGTRLHEYELLSVLGSGGFGVVYLAYDHELGQNVVIKEYLPLAVATRVAGKTVAPVSTKEAGNFRWGLDGFISEARTLAEFRQCPNVVSVLRYFKANNTGYMVMEYAGAVSLQDFLEVHQTLTEKQLLALVLPLLDALEIIHAKGVIHRDIKPGNILINDDSQPVLIDFGAARQAIGERTMSLTTVLTPEYAPFEQYHKTGQQGPWTDIYALAAVMFRCVTGTEPPGSAARMDAGDDPLVLAGKVKGDYSPHVLAAIEWGLRLRVVDRPQHVDAWRQRLMDADVQPVLAEPVVEKPGLNRMVAKVRQSPVLFHKRWVVASLLGGLLVIGLALAVTPVVRGSDNQALAMAQVNDVPAPVVQAKAVSLMPESTQQPSAIQLDGPSGEYDVPTVPAPLQSSGITQPDDLLDVDDTASTPETTSPPSRTKPVKPIAKKPKNSGKSNKAATNKKKQNTKKEKRYSNKQKPPFSYKPVNRPVYKSKKYQPKKDLRDPFQNGTF